LERVRVEGEQATALARSAERRKRRRLALGAGAVLVVAAVGGLLAVLEVQRRANADLAAKNVELADERAKVEESLKQESAARAQAKKNEKLANNNAAEAKKQQEVAEEQELLARRRFYAAQMNLAMLAWQSGEVPRVLELLEGQRPKGNGPDLRGFDWYYLWRLCNSGHRVPIQGHRGAVLSLAFSPDGKTLASASWDRTVGLWDVATGKQQRALIGHGRAVWDVAISPDGKTLATSGAETGSLILWDMRSGKPLHTIPKSVHGLAFSPDGKTLGGPAELWDVATGRQRAALPGAKLFYKWPEDHRLVGLCPDGKTLVRQAATFTDAAAIEVWDLESRKERLRIPVPGLGYAALSPDGKQVATASGEQVTLWDTATGKQQALISQKGAVRALAFSPDGKLLACGTDHRTVAVWSLETRQKLVQDAHLDRVWALAFSPDSKTLASATLSGAIKLWDMTRAEEATTITQSGGVKVLGFSPDSKKMLVAGDGPAKFFDVNSGKEISDLALADAVAASADGNRLARWAGKNRLAIWDLQTRREIGTLPVGSISGAALSPDGKMLATCDSWWGDKTVKLWYIATQQARTLKPSPAEKDQYSVVCTTFSADGKLLAAGFQVCWVTIWDAVTGKMKTQFPALPKTQADVLSVAFSPDRKLLAVGTNVGTVTLWQIETGKLVATMEGHTNRVLSLAFSPDGGTLATAGTDGTVRLWEVATGQERITLKGDNKGVSLVTFAPDGSTLATASSDGTVRLWRAANPVEARAP
jgi:WD40 repeat protein